jgi:endonuclease/exonuclease/phosphatase (EEP) superfamily protein YafD
MRNPEACCMEEGMSKKIISKYLFVNVSKLLSFRRKSMLAGDLNAKHPFWNSAVSNCSDQKLLELFDVNEFEISAPQCPTHYSHAGNGDVLDIVVHQNIRLSDVIVLDILGSDHMPIVFHRTASVV